MIVLTVRVLRDRWHLLLGTFCAIAIGVALVHAGLGIASTVASASPPAGLSAAEQAAYEARLSGANTLNGLASILGVFLTIFVVRSTVDFAITERRRELALLRLAGLKRRQLRLLLLGEAALLGAAGALAGAVLGVVVAAVQVRIFVGMGVLPDDVHVEWSTAHLVADAAVGIGVAVAGARAASRRATRITPLEALQRRGAEGSAMTRSRWIWGTLGALVTLAQMAAAVAVGGILGPLLLALGIIITGSIAMSQLSPLLVPLLAWAIGPAVRDPLGRLALAKIRGDARRAAQVAAPLIVLVGLVVGLQGLLDTQTKAGELEITTLTRADLLVRTHGDPSRRVAAVDGVASADTEVQVPARVEITRGDAVRALRGTVLAVEPSRFGVVHPHPPRSGSTAALDAGHIVFGPGVEDARIAGRIRRITLTVGGRTRVLREAARTGEGLAAADCCYVARQAVPDRILAGSPSTVLVTLERGAAPDEVRSAIEALALGEVTSQEEEVAELTAAKADDNRAVMTALVGVGSVYALISLLSTLAIAITQRRSELAVDRLAGITRRQVVRVVLTETAAILLIGLVLGTVVSVAALVGLWVGTWRHLGSPAVAVPWQLLGGVSVTVALLAAGTATVAALVATRRPPVHDIATQE
ncbi:ABC transporter permease [Nocardioides sp. zg-1228]|uniref:ABC transporter permease n=1 Tax=Nocardioides sp. zg-1228 TaxID=2763008 RepID=UPI0016434036|nr:FtsX-like permease family protein [Nocardioides sp. zg-1228]MBC2933059.1 FtsX-like permease family protein [Nocardioides sp. zg-1228]QSF56749.1 FtsX-like permease family protein [Nocardioides sp. zg-1228]